MALSRVETSIGELARLAGRRPAVSWRMARKLWRFYAASALGIASWGQRDYARFAIFGRYRTGSNLLRGSLMSHAGIVAFGDVFRARDAIRLGLPFYPQTHGTLALYRDDPVRFLETRIFAGFPARVEAVGLKMLYPNSRNPGWERACEYLGGDQALRVLHVKRRNVLRSHLSMQLKLRDGRWKSLEAVAGRSEPIRLEYEECRRAFEDTRRWEREMDAHFERRPVLEIWYEDLCERYESEMERVLGFLGVSRSPVEALTVKQADQPLHQSISNYDELRAGFRGSPWEAFFE